MSDLPIFSARGRTDSERLSELIAYLPSLSSAIDRQMMSLDYSNLNEDLRKKIDSGITEHQDLSGYASKNYVKNIVSELESAVVSIQENVNTLLNYVGSWSEYSPYSIATEFRAMYNEVSEIKSRVEELEKKA